MPQSASPPEADAAPPRATSAWTLLVVFVTAFATLALEIFYTRLFSALFWKNTAFAILSLAMLGIGASGVLVYLAPRWFTAAREQRLIAYLTSAFAASILLSYLWVLRLSRVEMSMAAPIWSYAELIVAGLLPFFAGGLILSVIFTHQAAGISRLYLFDLGGAALGAVLVLPMLGWTDGPLIVVVIAFALGAVALGYSLYLRIRGGTVAAAVVALVLIAAGWAEVSDGALAITHSDGKKEVGVVHERWDPLARVTVHRAGPATWFHIDSRVGTPVLRFDGDLEGVAYLRRSVLQLAYHLKRYPKIVIIGPGGGSDVLSALVFGNEDVAAVEVNRSLINLMRTELADYTGDLYDRPEVTVAIADGRAFVAGMREQVDLIQATFIDTYAASASGAHTLSENYLYTVDAIHDFLDHLTPEGVLSMSRWGGEMWGFEETYRTVSLALRALRDRGAQAPERHFVVVRGAPPDRLTRGFGYQAALGDMESMATILVKKSPFTDREIDRLSQAIEGAGFRPLWLGGRGGTDITLAAMFAAGGSSVFYRSYQEATGLDLSPITDNQPFFFDMIDPIDALVRTPDPAWEHNPFYGATLQGVSVLHQLLAATGLLVLLLIVVPLLMRLRDLSGVCRPLSTLGYFVCLGLGFIGIELGVIQSFTLFLGHPVYSLAVVLASILLFAGFGSASTAKVAVAPASSAAKRGTLLVLMLIAYGALLPQLTRSLLALPLGVKFAVCVLLTFPPAYLMGMMFPLGIKTVMEKAEDRLIPWVWGLNAAFSVLGAIASLMIAMSFGQLAAWYGFTAVYAAAVLAMWRLGPAPAT